MSQTVEEKVAEPPGSSSGLIHGRYEVVRELGRGGMGAVFLVADRRQGGLLLALKKVRVSFVDQQAAAALRNEFLSVAGLRHPGLAQIYDFGADRENSEFFFTSEFVNGVNFLETFRRRDPSRREDLEVLIDLIAQVLRALEFLHSRGLVHGDIKPENILVTEGAEGETAVPRAKLIDFGLARKEKRFVGKNVLGTLYYIAPETITGSQIDRRTDLYSLGCVLFHVLTGRPPFASPNNVEILRAHLEKAPEKPSRLRPEIPEFLDRFVLRLMEKHPASRYANALEALASLSEGWGDDIALETIETLRSYLDCARPPSVDAELPNLFGAFRMSCSPRWRALLCDLQSGLEENPASQVCSARETRAPDGRFVLIRGRDELAKERLAESFRKLVQSEGGTFLSVDCGANQGAQADFLVLLDEIECAAYKEKAVGLRERCEALRAAVRASESPAEAAPGVESLARDLLEASVELPIAIHFRGFEQAKELIARLVAACIELQIAKEIPPNQLFLTATIAERGCRNLHRVFRSTKARQSIMEICMDGLGEAETARFVESAFPGSEFSDRFLRTLYQASGGRSAVLARALMDLLEGGAIRRTREGWTLSADFREEELVAPLGEEIRRTLSALPEQALKLARAFAVLDGKSELETAAKLAGVAGKDLIEPMNCLLAADVLQEEKRPGTIGVYSFTSPLASKVAYGDMPPEERKALLERAATLAGDGEEAESERSVYLLRAGNLVAGGRAGLAVAKRLAARGLQHRALDLYDELLAAAAGVDEPFCEQIRYEKAQVLGECGQHREALEILKPLAESRRLDGRPPHPTLVLVSAARNCIRLGEHRDAAKYLERAAAVEKSQALPVSLVYVLAGYAELAAALGRWEECLGYCERILGDRARIHDKGLLLRVHLLVAEASRAKGNADRAIGACLEALKVADSTPQDAPNETSLQVLAKYNEYRGRYLEAALQLQACIMRQRHRCSQEVLGRKYLERGALELALERYHGAAKSLKQAERLLRRSGDAVGLARAQTLLARIHARFGEHEDCQKAIAEAFGQARRLSDAVMEAANSLTMAENAFDRGDFERAGKYVAVVAQTAPSDPSLALRLLALRSEVDLRRASYQDACGWIAQGEKLARSCSDSAFELTFLEKKLFLEVHLGVREEARATLQICRRLAARGGFQLSLARCDLADGILAAATKRDEVAGRLFGHAFRAFRRHSSERDLMCLFVAYSEFLANTEERQQALLYAEEAAYLAKKLELIYWRCRAQLARGAAKLAAGDDPQSAEELFQKVTATARKLSYLDILWRSLYHHALLAARAGDRSAAARHLEEAQAVRERVLSATPQAYREGYSQIFWTKAFEDLMAEIRA